MLYRILADATALLHFAFVLFVALGGLLVLRWRKLAWIHLPAAVWGALIEIMNWTCPLTAYENLFRERGGMQGYGDDFIAFHIFRLIYPDGLTRTMQFAIAAFVLLVNTAVYAKVFPITFRRSRRA
jgi:Protein of Unknown function (DUF2784)